MNIESSELDGGVTLVTLRGRLDTVGSGAIDLPFSVLAGSKRAIMVDLSQVDFLASLGIRTLLTGAKAVQRKGGKFAMFVPDGNVLEVLKTSGIDSVIPTFQDRAEAIAAVKT